MRPVWALLLIVLAALPAPADSRYDLGGPCIAGNGPATLINFAEARKTGAWDRWIAAAKSSVRNGCAIQYRWYELATVLLEAHKRSDALLVLEDMDGRGFDLNPALIDSRHQPVRDFMRTALFKASPLGMKIEQLERVSDERRARFRRALDRLTPAQRPPDNYVAKGACPFECCRYGRWNVLRDTDLFAAPGSAVIVGKATHGSRVDALTGEVHVKPEPVVVLRSGEPPKDTIAFILDRGGEGYGHVYTGGKIVELFVGVADYCFQVSDSCWGETLLPASGRKPQVWWIQVRLPNGVTGWTDQPANFGGNDACG